MKILFACEESGECRERFAAIGHDAWSCDLMPSAKPGQHYQGDVRDILGESWGMVIAFPPCTDLCVSGARWFAAKRANGDQQRAVDFFMLFTRLKCAWGIENPVGIMSSLYRKPDQIIQPWQFGEDASKATCLWLHGLPPLEATNVLPKPASGHWANQTASGQNKLGPSPTRARDRSRTYPGIAQAMADQWGRL